MMFQTSPRLTSGPTIRLLHGAWHEDRMIDLPLPEAWTVHRLDPDDAPALRPEQIEAAIQTPVGTKTIREIARQKRSAVIVVEDITRPTRVEAVIPAVVRDLRAGGLCEEKISILVATGAHRPMSQEEIDRKVPPPVRGRIKVHIHDFMGEDIESIGSMHGGPVCLNRLFLKSDMKICIGTVMPHNETGFGGGAKLVIPGVAGRETIAFLHGALPPRPRGVVDAVGGDDGKHDRRSWIESVAKKVGIDFAICSVVNARREIAGLFTGAFIDAHRAAARCSLVVGRTPIDPEIVSEADVVLVNAYPLDTDPVQMGKGVKVGEEVGARRTIIVNAASDGIFYHGMGMGGGVRAGRLARNLLAGCRRPADAVRFLRAASRIRHLHLLARYVYFSFNHLSYQVFLQSPNGQATDVSEDYDGGANGVLVYSPQFPVWGFVQRYREGSLFRDWGQLCSILMRKVGKQNLKVLVLPCAPLQIPCAVGNH